VKLLLGKNRKTCYRNVTSASRVQREKATSKHVVVRPLQVHRSLRSAATTGFSNTPFSSRRDDTHKRPLAYLRTAVGATVSTPVYRSYSTTLYGLYTVDILIQFGFSRAHRPDILCTCILKTFFLVRPR